MTAVVRFEVRAVDGECHEVPGLEIGARFRYGTMPATWSTATTDGEGRARFSEEHAEPPIEVTLFVGDQQCDTFPIRDGASLVLEL